MNIGIWISFLWASLLFGMIPGPSVCFTVAHGIRFGIWRTVPTILGQLAANGLQLLIITFGINRLLKISIDILFVIRVLGAVYIIYLGLKQWFAEESKIYKSKEPVSRGFPENILSGFIVCGSNPKAFLYYAAFIPQFIVPDMDQNIQVMVLGATGIMVSAVVLLFYAVLAEKVGRLLTCKGYWRIQNQIASIMMMAVGTILFFFQF